MDSGVETWKLECNTETGGYTKKSDKNNKKVKDYSYRERWAKLGLPNLLERRMRCHLIGTYKIINRISSYSRYLFNISPQIEIYCQDKFKKLSLQTNKIYFANKINLATVVEGELKAPFSIATTRRSRGGRYSFPWIAPL